MHACIADFLLDLVQNSWEAASTRIELELDFVDSERTLVVCLRDNGKGMTPLEVEKALDPFYTDGIKHPGRKVGLGLPFLKQTMEGLGQDFSIESEKGKGTLLRFSFPLDHVDCPPLGDLNGTLVALFAFEGTHEFVVRRRGPGTDVVLSRLELQEVLGDFDSVGARMLLCEYIESMEDDHGQDEP